MMRRGLRPLQQRAFSSDARAYDTVVVGGGIAGVSCAYHLARRRQRVLLLEQNALTSGSTWHAAGLVTHLKGNPTIAELSYYGRDTFKALERDDGLQIGWHETGSLGIARSTASAEALLHSVQRGHRQGHRHRVLDDFGAVKNVHPFVANPNDDFVLAVVSPEEGIVNPADATIAIAKKARSLGATLLENTPVTGFSLSADRRKIMAVKTATGQEFSAANVIIACSAWTRGLCKSQLQESVPLAYGPHQYTIFDKIAGVSNELPVIREYDFRFYCKPEVGSFLLGIFEEQPIPHIKDFIMERSRSGSVPRDAANEVYEEDLEKAGVWLERAFEVLPVLAETGVHRWLHGPDTHSPDHCFVLGPLLGVENAFVCSGFNSQGIQCGPGLGLAMAEWVVDGYPQSFRNHFEDHSITRFNPEVTKNDDWATYRALESYGGTYRVHMPREQQETVRGLALKSPFYDALIQKGGIFGEAFGWERPLYFDPSHQRAGVQNEWEELSPHPSKAATVPHEHYAFEFKQAGWFPFEAAEAQHCRQECVVFDLSPFGKIRVQGQDGLKLLQYAVTGNVDRSDGSIVYTSYCQAQTGGMLGDLTVCRFGRNDFYCVLPAADPFTFHRHLRQCADQVGAAEVSVQNCTADVGVLAVMGPKSRRVMQALFPTAEFDNGSFPFGTWRELEPGIRGLRVSFAGELGWELHVDAPRAMDTYSRLFTAAHAAAVDLRDAGMFALLNSLRIEKGFVHNGHDCFPTITPMEAGLAFTVDWKKEQFCGRDALKRRRDQGSKRRLASFILEDSSVSPHGHCSDVIYRDGERVGYLTSAGYSHALARPIGLGLVDIPEEEAAKPKRWLESGSYEVELVHRNHVLRTPARCSLSCVVDPKSHKAIIGEDLTRSCDGGVARTPRSHVECSHAA